MSEPSKKPASAPSAAAPASTKKSSKGQEPQSPVVHPGRAGTAEPTTYIQSDT